MPVHRRTLERLLNSNNTMGSATGSWATFIAQAYPTNALNLSGLASLPTLQVGICSLSPLRLAFTGVGLGLSMVSFALLFGALHVATLSEMVTISYQRQSMARGQGKMRCHIARPHHQLLLGPNTEATCHMTPHREWLTQYQSHWVLVQQGAI